jgi:hypothetical protein
VPKNDVGALRREKPAQRRMPRFPDSEAPLDPKYLNTNYLRGTATILLQTRNNNTTVIRLATQENR